MWTVRAALCLTIAVAPRSSTGAEPVMVVAFGDSTTAPRIVEGKSLTVYADVLRKELPEKGINVHVVNSGIGGSTTEHARGRFVRDVLAYRPELVVVQFGINDSAIDVWKKPPATRPRVAMDLYEKNLRHFLAELRRIKANVILMTPNPLRWTPKLKAMYGKRPYDPNNPDGFNVTLRRYADRAREIAKQERVRMIDVYTIYGRYEQAKGQSMDDLLLDGMHPNAKGQQMVADLLIKQIEELASEGKLHGPSPSWKRIGPGTLLNADCVEITHDASHECVFGTGLARLKSGAVISVYSAMNPYGPLGSTWIAGRTTADGGKTWSPERKIVQHPECKACHPSVLVTRDGVVHVFYLGFVKHAWKDGNPTPEEQSDIWTIRSEDGGKTWTGRQRIYKGYSGATNGAVETRGRSIVVPFSHFVSNPGRLVSRTVNSTDGGKTWTLSNALDIGGAGNHDGAIEPGVIQLKDGRLWMLIRTTRGYFWQSHSYDGGLSWTEATPTKIEATSAPGHLARLSDGRIALVWNPKRPGRRELWIALSADEGRTWSDQTVLAIGKQVTYPSAWEYRPGELWVGFHNLFEGWGHQRAKLVKLAVKTLDPK